MRKPCMGRELEILLEEEIEMNGEQCYLGHSKEYVKAVLKKQPQYGINDIVRVTGRWLPGKSYCYSPYMLSDPAADKFRVVNTVN